MSAGGERDYLALKVLWGTRDAQSLPATGIWDKLAVGFIVKENNILKLPST